MATPTLSIENPLATTIPTNATPLLNTTFLVNGTLLSNGAIDLTLANGTLVSLVNSTISVGGSNYTLAEDDNSLVDSVSGDDAIVEVSSTNGVDGEGIVELSLVDAVQIDEPALDLEIGTAPTAAEVLVLKRAASDHEKRAFEGGLVKGQLAPRHRDGEGRDVNVLKKRWVWATEIIQDSTPPSGLPPIGVNANLLTRTSPIRFRFLACCLIILPSCDSCYCRRHSCCSHACTCHCTCSFDHGCRNNDEERKQGRRKNAWPIRSQKRLGPRRKGAQAGRTQAGETPMGVGHGRYPKWRYCRSSVYQFLLLFPYFFVLTQFFMQLKTLARLPESTLKGPPSHLKQPQGVRTELLTLSIPTFTHQQLQQPLPRSLLLQRPWPPLLLSSIKKQHWR